MDKNLDDKLNNEPDFSEDFADFDEEDTLPPELESQEAPAQEIQEEAIEESQETENIEEVNQQLEEPQEIEQQFQQENEELNEEIDKSTEENEIIETEDEKQNSEEKVELSPWEEMDENNSVVKKYIFYVAKDYVPYIDKLSMEERVAYINDAIQMKIDSEHEENKKEAKKRLKNHFIIMLLIFLFATPVVLWLANKAIMATFDNYKYSQENFEKLYRARFEKDRAYMRSVQYNKEMREKLKGKK